jgi:histidine phosphotransferase ChpT
LKFFRLAFGAASGFAEEVETDEARIAIEGLFGGEGKIQLNWLVSEPVINKSALKVLLNLTLIAGDALVRGGNLTLGAERSGDGVEIVVRAEGARVAFDPEIKKALLGQSDEDAVVPRSVAAWLIHCLVEECGGQILVADEEEGVLVFGASLYV